MNFPDPEPFPGASLQSPEIPYFLIGSDAFPLWRWMIKPYAKRGVTDRQKIFHYRLLWGRRIVEADFSILDTHFQWILKGLVQIKLSILDSVILAYVMLHNFLIVNRPGMAQHQPDHIIINTRHQAAECFETDGRWAWSAAANKWQRWWPPFIDSDGPLKDIKCKIFKEMY